MIINGNCSEELKRLPNESIDCCITSPPYWGLRDYGVDNQLGLEKTPDEYVANMVKVFAEVKRVLKPKGTLWLNLGDSYSSGGRTSTTNQSLRGNDDYGVTRPAVCDSVKPKDLVGIPWMVAFALRSDGWYLRQDIIWHKPNPMPESVTDRCTKAHEYIFLLTKSARYYYDNDAIKEPVSRVWDEKNGGNLKVKGERKVGDSEVHKHGGEYPKCDGLRNKRSVWTVTTKPFKGAHFATFPEDLILPCVLAGCPEGGTILDPFTGAGTTGVVAKKNNRKFTGIELNKEYIEIAEKRINNTQETML